MFWPTELACFWEDNLQMVLNDPRDVADKKSKSNQNGYGNNNT